MTIDKFLVILSNIKSLLTNKIVAIREFASIAHFTVISAKVNVI